VYAKIMSHFSLTLVRASMHLSRAPIAFALAGLLALAGAHAQSARPPTASSVGAQVETLMARFREDAGVAGVSVRVDRDGTALVRGGWGLADRASGRAASADTTYRLGSVSKQFTAALILRLVERQQVALDDAAERHLPEMPRKWRGVTVRQLLNHTAGVPEFTATGTSRWGTIMTPGELLSVVANNSLQFAPGTKYEYSNSNYVLLALIAEKHYARPLAQILAQEIFTPLGMSASRFCEDAYGANGQARPYVRDDDQLRDAPYRSMSHSFGAGGVCSTAGDVALWNRALHTGKVVAPELYQLMTTPVGAAVTEGYGFGIAVKPIAGRRAFYHGGLVPGFITVNAWIPPEAVSVTILTNTSPVPQMQPLYRDLTRMALGLPVAIFPPVQGPVPNAAGLRQFAGTYAIQVPGQPLEMKFWVAGHTLMGQAAGQSEGPMRVVGDRTFGTARDWSIRFTFNVENGTATGFTFEQGGATFQGVRTR
jgi:D-alanyl-D-alanine carboxypeptidase